MYTVRAIDGYGGDRTRAWMSSYGRAQPELDLEYFVKMDMDVRVDMKLGILGILLLIVCGCVGG